MNIINKYRLAIVFSILIITFSSCKKENTIFNDILPYDGGTLTLSGIASTETGINAANSVFVDMSRNTQTSALRAAWDLGFYCSTTDFKVIINHSTVATIVQINKTDLSAVTSADIASLPNDSNTLIVGANAAMTTVDPVAGDFSTYLTGLVINNVSANDAENKVYILNRGRGGNIANRAFLKMKINRRTNGYTVSYAPIDQAEPSSFDVQKDASFNFKYLSFSSASVVVEPAKANWDFEWTLSTTKNAVTGLPVATPDFVQINFGGGVKAAEVIFGTDLTKNYDSFQDSDIESLTYLGTREVIGTNWRNAATSNASVLNINNDRFYVIQDPAGNYYKLRFSGGGRGRPELVFKLLRAAEILH